MIWMLPAGLVIATVAMFTGLGGGVLWVPFLIEVYDLPAREAIFCALVIQIFGLGSATIANLRLRLLDRGLFKQQAVAAVPTAVGGALLARWTSPVWIELALGSLIFVIAYAFLRGDDLFEPGGAAADLEAGRAAMPVAGLGGFLTGFLSVGIGGWLVPLFNRRCRLSMPRAVATAVALMLALSVVASACHFALGGRLRWDLTLVGIAGVVLGAQVGTRLHLKVSESRFKEIFVLLLVFLGAHVTFNAF